MVHIDPPGANLVDFTIKKGSTQPHLSAQLEDDEDNPINLTGSSVRFRMRAPGESSRKVDNSAVITDADNGQVAYRWDSSDTDTVGFYNAEFAVDYSGETGSNFEYDELFPSDRQLDIEVEESA